MLEQSARLAEMLASARVDKERLSELIGQGIGRADAAVEAVSLGPFHHGFVTLGPETHATVSRVPGA
jgi:hypothetical protein